MAKKKQYSTMGIQNYFGVRQYPPASMHKSKPPKIKRSFDILK